MRKSKNDEDYFKNDIMNTYTKSYNIESNSVGCNTTEQPVSTLSLHTKVKNTPIRNFRKIHDLDETDYN